MTDESKANLEQGSSLEAQLLFVKICFTSPSSGGRGVAVIRINGMTKIVEKIDNMSSNSSQYIDNISTMSPVVHFLDFLTQKRFRMDFVQKTTGEVNTCLKQAIEGNNPMEAAAIINDLIKFVNANDVMAIKPIFHPHLMRALYDKKLDIDVGVEITTQNKIDAYFKDQQANQKPADTESAPSAVPVEDIFNVGEGKILLDCTPVLSPVNGLSINKIKPGMDIMVRIDNSSIQGSKFNNLFNLITEEGKISPRSATVENVKIDGNTHKLLIVFGNNVYGKLIEAELVKIKLAEEADPKTLKKESKSGIFVTIALVVGLLGSLLLLYLFAMK